MNRLVPRILVLIVLAALAAGCTSSNNGGNGTDNGGTSSPPPQMSNAEAQTLLATAASEMPDRFGMTMSVKANGTEAMSMTGAFDNSTNEAYIEIKGNASAFGEQAQQAGAEIFEQGIGIYTTKEGSLYMANGTAFVFPPDSSSSGGFSPSSGDSPFADFVDPTDSFARFNDNTTVRSVTPTVYKGKPAVEIVATMKDDNHTTDATVIVWTSPKRIAHMNTTLPEQGPGSPLSGAEATIDFAYDDDVTLTIPPAAKRAVGLTYKSSANPFGGDDDKPVEWTFQRSGGIALGEIEVHVKDAAAAAQMEDKMDYAHVPTLWSMKLSEGSKGQDGVTLSFADKDGDGKVSANDTLTITSSGGEPATAVLYDTVTKTYVVPGFEAVLLVGAGVGLAMLLRRK